MLVAVGHRVIVKPDEVEKVSPGGIVLTPDERLEEAGQQKGTLVSVGPQAWKAFREIDENGKERNGRPWAKPGDYVYYARYAGKIIRDPDTEEKYMILSDDDILAVIVTVDE